jgi:hypothetical protein
MTKLGSSFGLAVMGSTPDLDGAGMLYGAPRLARLSRPRRYLMCVLLRPHAMLCVMYLVACDYPPLAAHGGVDASPGTATCFGSLVVVCLAAPATAALVISTPTMIDTDTEPMCVATVSGGDYCVLSATTISIDAPLRASGSRPLVMIASDSITTTATIDVGGHRGVNPETGAGADPAICTTAFGTAPTGGGGGAGGSLVGLGGAGGESATSPGGSLPGAAATTTNLRGGCRGQDGDGTAAEKGLGGHGGGAVLLIARNNINIGGEIDAAGEGGGAGIMNESGGGGGGAGGMIALDAPTVACTNLLLANGGGGGEASGTSAAGKAGSDPSTIGAAPGGSSGSINGGDGGAGSAGPAGGPGAAGSRGTTVGGGFGGGGGGGGGAGVIRAAAAAALGTQVSPAATS